MNLDTCSTRRLLCGGRCLTPSRPVADSSRPPKSVNLLHLGTANVTLWGLLSTPGVQRIGNESVPKIIVNDTHIHPFNGPFSWTTRVGRYQKGKTNLDFTEARDSEWQWHQLGRMQVCTSLQADNHASTPPLSFLQAGCPSCRPTNSVKDT